MLEQLTKLRETLGVSVYYILKDIVKDTDEETCRGRYERVLSAGEPVPMLFLSPSSPHVDVFTSPGALWGL